MKMKKRTGFLIAESVVASACAAVLIGSALAAVRMASALCEKADTMLARERKRAEMIAVLSSGSDTASRYIKKSAASRGAVNYISYLSSDGKNKDIEIIWTE
ncbi:MAG: hypothetical protein Q4E17_01070 [Synergistes sp.]|nr:hypothetical protein [Synergistes sp.]